MVKGFRQIALLTVLSRVFGLLRDVAYSHFFGANNLMDAWTLAFKIPNLSRRIFGEGAASASFIPVYSQQLHENPALAKELINTVVTVLFIILAGITLLGQGGIWIFFKAAARTEELKLALSLTSLMLPYMLFICLVAILAGILNVHKHFAAPAAAPIILNLCIIFTILFTGKILHISGSVQLFATALGVLLAGVLQLGLQLVPLKKAGVSIRPQLRLSNAAFRRIIFLMGPMILGLTATQLNTLFDDLIAWIFSGSDQKGYTFEFFGSIIEYPLTRGSVSHLYYSQRLYQFPLGVLGIALATAIFPVISEAAARKDYENLTRTLSQGIRSAFFIALPAMVGLWIVGRPLVALVFEHGKFTADSTGRVNMTLGFYALGLCGYFLQQIATRGFYAVQDSKVPALTAVLAVFVNIILNLILIWPLGTAGLALSTAISSYFQVFILLLLLNKRFEYSIFLKLGPDLVKTLIATCVMFGAGLILMRLSGFLDKDSLGRVIYIAVSVSVLCGIYYICSLLMKIPMLSLLFGRLKK